MRFRVITWTLLLLAGAAMGGGSNLDEFLGGRTDTATGAAAPARATTGAARTQTAPSSSAPAQAAGEDPRPDALPGVVILSDGTIIPGRIFTTLDKSFEVWVETEQRWRHVHPLTVLSIRAVVIEEVMDKEWRWKEMGSDERVFTGRERPVRRFLWTFRLIDGSTITGAVKGQPLWVASAPTGVRTDGDRRAGPYILKERDEGAYGTTLAQQVYVQRVVISKSAMEKTGDR